MSWRKPFALRFRSLLRRDDVEAELDAELRFHIQKQVEENLASGMDGEEARFAALRSFGALDLQKEVCRDVRSVSVIEHVLYDVRHACRVLRRDLLLTITATTILAICIGANTTVFSVVNALLLRSLPFRSPDRLAAMSFFLPPHDTAAQFDFWRTHSSYLQDAALFEDGDLNIGDPEHMLRAHIAMTSWNFFSLLGSQPVIGRTFLPGDHSIAVISYGMWQQLYAGSHQVLGKRIHVYGLQPHPDELVTIVGVMPPDFDFPANTLVWKAPEYTRGNNGWVTIGRLKPGMSWAQARIAFVAEAHQHRRLPADLLPRMFISLQDALAGRVKYASLLLMAGVVLILLIACANLSNLTLARTAERRYELSIRSAMGASRGRLIQQLLTECLLLAIISAALGLTIAIWAASLASKTQPAALASQTYTILDVRVLAFVLGLSVVSTVLFGLLPALSGGRRPLFAVRGPTALRSQGLRNVLIAAQVALTIVLLIASVSVMQALSHELRIDRGFRADGLVTASVALEGTVRGKPGERLEYFEEVLDHLRRLPEVRSASATEFLPLLSGKFLGGPYAFDGHPSPQGTATDVLPIMAGYFATTSGHILYGREFTDAEVRSNAKVAIVNETLARIWLHNADAVGHMLTGPDGTVRTIIGVVRNLDFMGPYISDVFDLNPPESFVPAHNPGGFDSTFVVKINGRSEEHVAAIRATVQAVDLGVPVYSVETMQQRMNQAFARPKFFRTALVFFASFALLLSLIGIYATVSYAVTQRTHEMGIRLALGIMPTRLRIQFVRQGLATVVFGITVGLAGAANAEKLLSSFVEGVRTLDLAAYSLATLSICVIAAASIWIATRRIARVDIAETLRNE
jgi:predicted permease